MSRVWWVLCTLLLVVPTPALADAQKVLQFIGIGLIVTGNPYGSLFLTASSVYGTITARREARREAARQRAQFNSSLSNRTVTVLTADPPLQVVYGRCPVGGAIVDIFSTDKVVRNEDGSTRTKADGYKHLVVVFASHRCQAINEVYLDGIAVGAVDGSGWATGGEFFQSRDDSRETTFDGTTITLSETPLAIISAHVVTPGGGSGEPSYAATTVTISGNTLTGPGLVPVGSWVQVAYTVAGGLASVRYSKHLGSDTEAVDSYLASIAATRYTAAHGLRGLTAITITLDLEDARFTGTPPNIVADVSGALLYDPRKDSTVPGGSGTHRVGQPSTWEHSRNNALCVRDFLTRVEGFNADDDEVNTARTIAAANACDAPISLVVGGVTTAAQPTYTCNGAFTTADNPEAVLEDLTESMAGTVVYGADWQINAGVWTPPVADLTDADLRGPIEVVHADTPTDQLFNGLRGQYIPAGQQKPADIDPPYQNAAFVTADGEELWNDRTLPFTDNPARARNLARIFTERARSGQVLQYPAKITAWPLEVGDRVRLTSTALGIPGYTYRITDWQFDHPGGVTLTLQRDAASIWDLADAANANPTPNTDLANPWQVASIASLVATSGTATLLRQRDGTIVPRVKLTWAALSDAYVLDGGFIDVRYRRASAGTWQRVPDVAASDTVAYIEGVREGEPVLVEVTAVNRFGKRGAPSFAANTVVGKSALPADVTGLAAAALPGGVGVTVTPSTEVDVVTGGYLELRVGGANWAAATRIFRAPADRYTWPWPAAGTYTLRAKWVDSSGNESSADATISVTVGSGNLINIGQLTPNLATDVYEVLATYADIAFGSGASPIIYTGLSFTSPVNAKVVVTANFDASVASAYDNARWAAVFIAPMSDVSVGSETDYSDAGLTGSYTLGDSALLGSTRTKCSVTTTFTATAGVAYLAGLAVRNAVPFTAGPVFYGRPRVNVQVIKL